MAGQSFWLKSAAVGWGFLPADVKARRQATDRSRRDLPGHLPYAAPVMTDRNPQEAAPAKSRPVVARRDVIGPQPTFGHGTADGWSQPKQDIRTRLSADPGAEAKGPASFPESGHQDCRR